MNIEALVQYREELLASSTSEDGFLSEKNILETVLPELVDCKLIDSEDVQHTFFEDSDVGKINAYTINESGERLQIFILNKDSVMLQARREEFLLSKKSDYEKHFASVFSLSKNPFVINLPKYYNIAVV